jgi:catechol 2,3-dioxygenase-like lactoylglutathione lyase family enzyme
MSQTPRAALSRRLIVVPIAVLCGCALVAIVLILGGSGVDDTSGRVLGTAASLAAASLMASACFSLAQRRPGLAAFAYFGLLATGVAFLFGFGLIWTLGEDSDLARPFGVAAVLALAAAHASLLLGGARENDRDAIVVVRNLTLGAMALLAAVLCLEISSPGSDVSAKAIGVLAVLYILGSLVLPLIRAAGRTGKMAAASPAPNGTPLVRLEQIGVTTTDPERSSAFYFDVLGIGLVDSDPGQFAYRFSWPGPIGEAVEHLRRHGIEIVAGPAPTQGPRGPLLGVSFRDPDGRLIELIAY